MGRESRGLGTKLGAFVVPTISFQHIRSTVSSTSLHQVAVLALPSDFQGRFFQGRVDASSTVHPLKEKQETAVHPGVDRWVVRLADGQFLKKRPHCTVWH